MNPRRAVVFVLASLPFAGAVRAQVGEALRAEIAHELSRPPATDVAGLEAQVLRLQALLRQSAAAPVAPAAEPSTSSRAPGAAAPTAAPNPAPSAAGAAESRPTAAGGTATSTAERMRALLRRGEPGGGDVTRPDLANPRGYVYLPATTGDQSAAKPQDGRSHMSVPFKKPKRTAGGDALRRTFPSNGGVGTYGGFGGGFGGGYGSGSSSDPRFGNGYDGR